MIEAATDNMDEMNASSAGGGAHPDEVIATSREDVCGLPIGDTTDAHRFAAAALDFLRRWIERRPPGDPLLTGVVAFVFSDDLQNEGDRVGAGKALQMFATRMQQPLAGHIFLSTASAGTVRPLRLVSTIAGDAAEEISSFEMGAAPAVVADLTEAVAYVCYHGTSARNPAGEIPYYEMDLRQRRVVINRQAVEEFLKHFHAVCVETPRDAVNIWAHPSQGIAVKAAEQAIQGHLVMMAQWEFKTCSVVHEPKLSDSRADVLIYPLTEGEGERTVLELKVLREKHFHDDPQQARPCYPRENLRGLVKGIDQAKDYKKRLGMTNAFVCAYDMRAEDDPSLTDKFAPLAEKRGILLRRFYLYRDAEHRRQCQPDSMHSEFENSLKRKSN